MLKKLSYILFSILFSNIALAQNAGDALRYTLTPSFGTARYTAMGNSMQALGGDFSAIHSNPGGLGIYRRSEFSFTPSVRINTTKAEHNGENSSRVKGTVNFDHIAYAKTTRKGENYGSLFGTFAFGYNRLADFNRKYRVSGPVTESSFLDVVYSDLVSKNIHPDDVSTNTQIRLETTLAWETYLLDTLDGGVYFHSNEYHEGQQIKDVETSGGMNSIFISYGENYENKLFWGVMGELITVNYRERMTYREILPQSGRITDLQEFTFKQDLNTTGTGFKLKLGLIYKIDDMFRVGLAYHTPTTYSLEDTWNQEMQSFIDVLGGSTATSADFESSYQLRTPGRLNLSGAMILGKKALISASYEYVDYSASELKSSESGFDFTADNDNISSIYRAGHTFNLGGEYRIDHFSIRAGYRHLSDPYTKESNNTSVTHIGSIGGGYRNGNFFADLSWKTVFYEENTWLYDSFYISPSQLKNYQHLISATIGFRWK